MVIHKNPPPLTNEFEQIFTERPSRLNEEELEITRCYLLTLFGWACNRCTTPFNRLSQVAEVDHVNGNPYDSRLRNLQLLCHKCNSIKAREQPKTKTTREMTYESKVFTRAYDKLHQWILLRIKNTGHCCVAEALSDGSKYAGCHRVTSIGYIEMEKGVETGYYDEHEMTCDSPNCNGRHLFQKGTKPQKISGEGKTEKYILVINEDVKPDYVDSILDADILRNNLPVPTTWEKEVFDKMNLDRYVVPIFENLWTEARKNR